MNWFAKRDINGAIVGRALNSPSGCAKPPAAPRIGHNRRTRATERCQQKSLATGVAVFAIGALAVAVLVGELAPSIFSIEHWTSGLDEALLESIGFR